MGDLTKNISKHELKCHCGNCEVYIQSHEPIIPIVQDCCDYFAKMTGVDKVSLKITSAARCQPHNRSVGSNDESQHIRCSAMDIQIFSQGMQVSPDKVYHYFDARFPDACGVGKYETFTHFDTRTEYARW